MKDVTAKRKVLTLNELQTRICYLEERLQALHDAGVTNDVIIKFEEQTIVLLKKSLQSRIVWWLRCTGMLS
jgi:FAD synthase